MFFHLGPNSLFSLFFLVPLHFHLFYFTLFYCRFVSPFLFLSLFTNSFSFSFLTPFSLFPFLPCLYYSHVFLLSLDIIPTDYIPPLNFSFTEMFIVLIFYFLYIFPLSFGPYFNVPQSWVSASGNLPYSSTILRLFSSSFLFNFAIYYQFLY